MRIIEVRLGLPTREQFRASASVKLETELGVITINGFSLAERDGKLRVNAPVMSYRDSFSGWSCVRVLEFPTALWQQICEAILGQAIGVLDHKTVFLDFPWRKGGEQR